MERGEGRAAPARPRTDRELGGGLRALARALGLDHLEERIDHRRVPLRAAFAEELRLDRGPGERLAVHAVGRHRVVAVGEGDDRDLDRELPAAQPAGVAAAVDSLVVRADELRAFPERRELLEERVAVLGVLAHDLALA